MTELRAKWRKDGCTRSGQFKGTWWARYHTHIDQVDPKTGSNPPLFHSTKMKKFSNRYERDRFVKDQNKIVESCSTNQEYINIYMAVEALTKD